MKTGSKNCSNLVRPIGRRARWLAGVLAFATGGAWAATTTYTSDADFALGTLSGVNYTVVSNQLQLNRIGTTSPIMWIANAGEDSVSKFDTVNNRELARYRTWFGPAGMPGYVNHLGNGYAGAAPSRTSVDLEGNAYVLNRHFDGRPARLFKILAEGGIDRNGNGVIDTSFDANNDGIVTAAEMQNLGDANGNGAIDADEIQDERIAWSVPVGPANGLGRALCIGTDGHLWVGMYNNRTYYKVSSVDGSILAGPISTTPTAGQPSAGAWTPYGCLIDRNGVLWSASLSSVLGKISNTSSAGPYEVASYGGWYNYGIALGNGKVYLGGVNEQFDPATGTFSSIPNMGISSAGIVTDGAGNIISGTNVVRKVSPTGTLVWEAPPQAGGDYAIGVQVDSNGDVWQIGYSGSRLSKYRGTDGAPLGIYAIGNSPYTYSDATGLSARTVTNNTGTWSVVNDGGTAGTLWGRVSWNAQVPLGGSVGVRVRAADSQVDLPFRSYVTVSNGTDIGGVEGRYVQIEARLNANLVDESPLLYDLTVASVPRNQPPTVNIVTPTDGQLISAASGPVVLNATLSDPNPGDTHTCAINWDDGTAPAAGVVSEAGGSGTCVGSRALAAGVYSVAVQVRDAEAMASDSVMFVVYDPNGGFVTGGGWIQSPAGAFTLDPALSGRAEFGFVSKYLKGATRPTGNTEFRFQVGNLHFSSDSYEWLVVAGARAQYKGTGKVNGNGDYGFMLTAVDGQVSGGGGVDKFRMKIWDRATGSIVYDNQLGAGDDAAPSTAISGGSIVIHTKR
jgi:hypothetical protein